MVAALHKLDGARPVIRVSPENRAWLALVFGVEAVYAIERGEL